MRSFFFLGALPLLVSAWSEHTLLTRATGNDTICETNDKVCGAFCIPSDYTCCPDLEGGCSADAECQKGDNGVYGCCPTGETCTGDGGAEYIEEGTGTATTSAIIAGATNGNGAQSLLVGPGMTIAAVAAGLVALI